MATPTNKPEDPKFPKNDKFLDYLKGHVRETIIYVLLVLGIVFLFFNAVYGGLLVGIVTGIYYGQDIIAYITNWQATLDSDSHRLSQHLISAGIAVAFLISVPAIFLGTAIAIAITHLCNKTTA